MHICLHAYMNVCMYAHWQHRALVHGNCGDQRIRPEQTQRSPQFESYLNAYMDYLADVRKEQYGATVEHVCPTTNMMGLGGGGGGV